MSKKILLKRGTAANLPSLDNGEPGWATDTKKFYVGDGDGSPVLINPGTPYTESALSAAGVSEFLTAVGLDTSLSTFALPDSTTISTFGKAFVAQADSAAARSSLGAQALDATLTALAGLTLTGGCLISATGADAPTVVASGAANTKLFMNASASAPEFSSGIKVGTFTRAMDADTADVAYDGVGFKPSTIIFFASRASTNLSVGMCTSSANYCVYTFTTPSFDPITKCIMSIEDGFKYQSAVLKTMDVDGFTLTWTKSGSPASANATIYYLALR